MNKIFNTLKKNDFIALVLLGIVIQVIIMFVTYIIEDKEVYTYATCSAILDGPYEKLSYALKNQWFGYIIQLFISWRVMFISWRIQLILTSIKKIIKILVTSFFTVFIIVFIFFYFYIKYLPHILCPAY